MSRYTIISIYLISAIIIQALFGNFPIIFMSFPVNIIVALLWCSIMWYSYKEAHDNKWVRIVSSPHMSIDSIILLAIAMLILGFVPQSGDASALGFQRFTTSWIFVAVLFLLMTNLGMTTLHGIYHKKKNRYRFLLNHLGLWLALFGGFFGSADTSVLRVPAYRGVETAEAYDANGTLHILPYTILYNSLEVSYYDNNVPKHFAANLKIGEDDAQIEINSPLRYNISSDIYLVSYDASPDKSYKYCVFQIVEQPWKYFTITGIIMMMVGAGLLFINGPKREKL